MSNSSTDIYKTLAKPSRGIFKSKGSKFLAFGFPIKSEEEAKLIVAKIRKEYHDARHHCFAWCLGLERNTYRINDDGEPSGTAGRPIYGQIMSSDISDVLIVVVRYFGGTLLGTRGLIEAYKYATKDCISNANLTNRVIEKELIIKFGYDLINNVMRIIKEDNLTQLNQAYEGNVVELELLVRLSAWDKVLAKFEGTYGIEIMN